MYHSMLINTTYSVEFPISNVELRGTFSPQPGLTAVIGPNGVGKTFTTIELTRYLLYGKKALRGAAADYKKLSASGRFVIRGSEYQIFRTPKKEEIFDVAGNILAVGADAVTKKVVELMGYGLEVFDIANASVQKKADLFGQMIPSKRKQLIDEVVGLTNIEHLEKQLRTEATGQRREAEALTRQLRVPQEPVRPKDYTSSAELGAKLEELRILQARADNIANTIRPFEYPETPHSSVKRPAAGEVEDTEGYLKNFEAFESERIRLEKLTLPQNYAAFTREQLEIAAQRLMAKTILADTVTCPKCGNAFVPGHEHVELPDGPDLDKQTIANELMLIEKHERAQEAAVELAELMEDFPPDPRTELKTLYHRRDVWTAYDSRMEHAKAQEQANQEAYKALRELGEAPGQDMLDRMADRLVDARVYEAAVERYFADQTEFERLSAEISEKERLSKEFVRGAEELSSARADLKTLLSPILSQVASHLIDDMTYGKLTSVQVDEDMEIEVNGQRIETLSGGGETVANIALRLALGQVLVAQTFPVFFGDEMDADADDVRRAAITDALRALVDKKHLKQIILVTHRGVDIADHVIDLGDTG